ncbi:MAG TPA: adenosine deaminase [Candidatus Dormibacteraeota bacterium]|jgi:adenosine deaminase
MKGFASPRQLAELHVHLEGTVRYETARELAAEHGLPAPPPYEYSNLAQFLQLYRPVAQSMQTSADFERVIAEHAGSMAAQGIGYSELSFNPSLHPGSEWIGGVERGRERAREEFGVEIAWLVEMSRELPAAENELALDIALATEGVVGLGLVGDESIPAEPLASLIDRAHSKGLRFMPHAGQTGGPEVVREAVEILGADRIAHGVAAIDDTSLLTLLADRRVCLCVCPSSNAKIGLRADYGRLASPGVPLTVNSDDPSMVGTTLARELELAETQHRLDVGALVEASLRYRFG